MTDKADWLAGLKVGDRAIAGDHFVGIGRLTPCQIITERGIRYRRKDGRQLGDRYAPKLQEPTTERRQAIRHKELARLLACNVEWTTLPLATLEAVFDVVTQTRKAKP